MHMHSTCTCTMHMHTCSTSAERRCARIEASTAGTPPSRTSDATCAGARVVWTSTCNAFTHAHACHIHECICVHGTCGVDLQHEQEERVCAYTYILYTHVYLYLQRGQEEAVALEVSEDRSQHYCRACGQKSSRMPVQSRATRQAPGVRRHMMPRVSAAGTRNGTCAY